MNEIIIFFGWAILLLLPCLVFSLVISYSFPISITQEKKPWELEEEYAKENGLVLHQSSYREGSIEYVRPEYQKALPMNVKLARKHRFPSMYQVSASQANW